jgi:hypothetical protein
MNRPTLARSISVVVVLVALLAATAGSALAQEGPPTERFIPCNTQSAEHSPVIGPNLTNPGERPPESRCPIGGPDPAVVEVQEPSSQ